MSLWNRLFGKSTSSWSPSVQRELVASEPQPDFPYELVRVTGGEAVQAYLRLREEGRDVFTPVMLGDLDAVKRIKEFFSEDEEATVQSYLEKAATLTAEGVLNLRKPSESDYYDQVEEGE